MPREVSDNDESREGPNRAQRRHPFLPFWLKKPTKLQDPVWRAEVRKKRKKRNKFIKKQRRLNARSK